MKKLLMGLLASFTLLAHAEFKLPSFEQITLSNGMTMYLMEQHEVPLIATTVAINRGAAFDQSKVGLASLTVDALLDGSQHFDKQSIAQAFDFRGADISSGAQLDSSRVITQWLAKDHDELLPILVDVILHPVFPEVEFNKLRDLREQELNQAKQSPRQVIGDYFRRQLFGQNAYGQAINGSVSNIKSFVRDDAATFYAAHYCPAQTAITVVGDFNVAQMKSQIEQAFGSWKTECVSAQLNVQRSASDKASVLLVNKADARETTFMIGSYGITQNDRDMIQLDVINTILGGRFTSWLNDELRVNSGLTYGARSSFNAMKADGTFAISSFTAQKNTEAALNLALDTYQRLWTKGIDASTLKSAQAYVKGLYPPRFETASQLSHLLADMYVNGYGRERIDGFTAAVDSLTVARCKELIAKHFKRDNLHMTLVGQADAIRDIAKRYGEVKEIDINVD